MKLFLVGGAVRETFLGQPPEKIKDYDFAVEAESFEEMVEELKTKYNATIWQARPEFVTVRARASLPYKSFGGLVVPRKPRNPESFGHVCVDADFTLCRKEAMYHDNRHPSEVTPADIWTDLTRRDFTMNAIAITEDGGLFDPYDGRAHMATRQLHTVGFAENRFEEDPLRMLRALRFSIVHGFKFSAEIEDAFWSKTLYGLKTLPVERIQSELNRALQHNWWNTMATLTKYPMLAELLTNHFPRLWFKATTEER